MTDTTTTHNSTIHTAAIHTDESEGSVFAPHAPTADWGSFPLDGMTITEVRGQGLLLRATHQGRLPRR